MTKTLKEIIAGRYNSKSFSELVGKRVEISAVEFPQKDKETDRDQTIITVKTIDSKALPKPERYFTIGAVVYKTAVKDIEPVTHNGETVTCLVGKRTSKSGNDYYELKP